MYARSWVWHAPPRRFAHASNAAAKLRPEGAQRAEVVSFSASLDSAHQRYVGISGASIGESGAVAAE